MNGVKVSIVKPTNTLRLYVIWARAGLMGSFGPGQSSGPASLVGCRFVPDPHLSYSINPLIQLINKEFPSETINFGVKRQSYLKSDLRTRLINFHDFERPEVRMWKKIRLGRLGYSAALQNVLRHLRSAY